MAAASGQRTARPGRGGCSRLAAVTRWWVGNEQYRSGSLRPGCWVRASCRPTMPGGRCAARPAGSCCGMRWCYLFGDGFSHARALGLQLCLAAVPLLIALNGLATKLGDPHLGGRVVAETVLTLTPGASESLVSQLPSPTRGAPAT